MPLPACLHRMRCHCCEAWIATILALLLSGVAVAGTPARAPAGNGAATGRARMDRALEQALQRSLPAEGLAIGVVLKRDDLPGFGPSRRAPLRARQQRVLNRLPAGFQLSRRYEALCGFSGWADAAAIDALRAQPEVDFVYLQPKLHFTLSQGVPLIGGSAAHALGYTGAGVNVAIIDSGIDTNHGDLMDDLVAEACFCNNNPNPNVGCCPNGDDEDFGSGAAEDLIGHGTQVSGVVTSAGNVAGLGIAPDAGIVAIRIAAPNYGPTFADAEAAIDWILMNRATYDIEIVNMSFGDGGEYNSAATCPTSNFANALESAHALGILLFASTGNDAHNAGVAFPACVPEVIAVGGSYDAAVGSASWCTNSSCSTTCRDNPTSADQFVCHTNSGGLLDVLAPDWRTTTSAIGGGTANVGGTSFSSPYAAGQAAVLRQADPSLTPTQMRTLLQSHGPMVTDPGNGLSFRRTDLALAVNSLVGTDTDSDGIFDDGDVSGTVGDNRCVGGATVACDDNCISSPNANQADLDSDGTGDVCDVCPNDPFDDADGDGVCGDVDACEGFDDNLDNDADGIPDACDSDDDNDGLQDNFETNTGIFVSAADAGSDPFDPDSDGDGYLDGVEVLRGSDPNDPQSLPVFPLPALSAPATALLVSAILLGAGWALRRRRALSSRARHARAILTA